MKLSLPQLEAQLKKTLSPFYVISGDEIILKQDALNLIRKAAKQAGFTERMRLTPDAGFDWDQLHHALYAGSLLAEKRIIELDLRNATPNKNAATVLHDYTKQPVSDHLLLIETGKLEEKISRSAWYKAMEKSGTVVPIWPINRDQLPSWIMQRAKKYKLSLSIDAANLLADHVEGNLSGAAQAIEKFYLLKTDNKNASSESDVDLMKALLSNESRFTVFDFLENVIAGHKTRSLHILAHLEEEGTEPVLIVWGIARELRLLSDLIQQAKQGTSIDSLLQSYRIFFGRQAAFRRFLSWATVEDCWRLLKDVSHIDQMVKGALSGNAWDALRLFCLRLSPC